MASVVAYSFNFMPWEWCASEGNAAAVSFKLQSGRLSLVAHRYFAELLFPCAKGTAMGGQLVG